MSDISTLLLYHPSADISISSGKIIPTNQKIFKQDIHIYERKETVMIKRLLSKGWYFSNNMKDYTPVDLPHDYQISSKRTPTAPSGSSNGYYPDKKEVYVK